MIAITLQTSFCRKVLQKVFALLNIIEQLSIFRSSQKGAVRLKISHDKLKKRKHLVFTSSRHQAFENSRLLHNV